MAFKLKLIGETRGDEVNFRDRTEYARAIFDIYYGGSKHYLDLDLNKIIIKKK